MLDVKIGALLRSDHRASSNTRKLFQENRQLIELQKASQREVYVAGKCMWPGSVCGREVYVAGKCRKSHRHPILEASTEGDEP